MKEYQSLCHTKWDCKYHIVFIPKRRKKMIFGAIRKHLGEIFHELAKQKECQIVEGHLMPGSCAYLCQYSPEVFRIVCRWPYQRQKCDLDSKTICRENEELHWGEFLGKRLFCYHGWS